MPSADMTVPVYFWPLRTRSEIVAALWDILDTIAGAAPDLITGFNEDKTQKVYLQVVSEGGVAVAEAPIGSVVVRNSAGWEVLTVTEAESRGLPLPEMLDTAGS